VFGLLNRLLTPSEKRRQAAVQEEWLLALPADRVAKRLKLLAKQIPWIEHNVGGFRWVRDGFFETELDFLAESRECEAERREAGRLAIALRDGMEKKRQAGAQLEEQWEREAAEERLEEARELGRIAARQKTWEKKRRELAARTDWTGDVRKAAIRTAELYLDSSAGRELKQCIAIASQEEDVAWESIQAYLAGVGVRKIRDVDEIPALPT
jgi:hypothetical protein